MLLKECPNLLKMATLRPITPEVRFFLKNSQCAFLNGGVYVCCAENKTTVSSAPPKTVPEEVEIPDWYEDLKAKVPVSPMCGMGVIDKIFGGTETAIGEFPWAALLQYKNRILEQHSQLSFNE